MTTYNRRDRYGWRSRCRQLIWQINWLLALFAVAILMATTAHAAPRCPGGQPDGRGGCVYVNPAPGYLANPSPYRICSTKLVAGVAVRSCSYGANPTVERRGR